MPSDREPARSPETESEDTEFEETESDETESDDTELSDMLSALSVMSVFPVSPVSVVLPERASVPESLKAILLQRIAYFSEKSDVS